MPRANRKGAKTPLWAALQSVRQPAPDEGGRGRVSLKLASSGLELLHLHNVKKRTMRDALVNAAFPALFGYSDLDRPGRYQRLIRVLNFVRKSIAEAQPKWDERISIQVLANFVSTHLTEGNSVPFAVNERR